MTTDMTIGHYLLQQLHDHGVRHVFGIPGDYSLSLIEEMGNGPLEFRNTCDEQGAGFAADGYARVAGLGAVCITYAVGSLKVANTTAQAFAERSPVVVICGAPGLRERVRHPLLHHRVNQFDTQVNIFRHLTVASTVLDNPETAFAEIDRVLHAAERHKLPVYIEVPRDMVAVPGMRGHLHRNEPEVSDPEALAEALRDAGEMLAAARQPVIIAGVELKRFGMHEQLLTLATRMHIPIAVTIQGKSVVCDDHPLYLGLYAGAIGREETARYVEASDCQLLLGVMLNDMNLGMFTAHLEQARMIQVNTDGVAIRHHRYDVRMPHFIAGLCELPIPADPTPLPSTTVPAPFHPEPGRAITVARLFERLQTYATEDTMVLADIGDSLFGALDMRISRTGGFLCTPYYSNMGFAVPGSIGVQTWNPHLRPLVLVGDGAFQMTGMELSTAARYGLAPIVLVLNNQGYATERFFLDGPFNEIHPWNFNRLPEIFNAGAGFTVRTEEELESALAAAKANSNSFALLDIHLARGDVSPGLRKLGAHFGKTVRG